MPRSATAWRVTRSRLTQLVQPEPRILMIMAISSFAEKWVSGISDRDDGVEEVADGDDANAGHGHERGNERGFQDAAQQDELGQTERDHGHHEGKQGAHRQAL